jgi:hypothetical protein
LNDLFALVVAPLVNLQPSVEQSVSSSVTLDKFSNSVTFGQIQQLGHIEQIQQRDQLSKLKVPPFFRAEKSGPGWHSLSRF